MIGAALVLTLGLLAAPPGAASDSLGDLPLIPEPAPSGPLLAVMLTGDGGWSAGDRALAAAFVQRHVAVVGLNSARYLSRARTPDEAGADLTRILRHFLPAWHRERVVVVGYSRGADIGPFMISRLPCDLRDRVALVTLLGPGEFAGFKAGLLDVLHSHTSKGLQVSPEVAALRGTSVLCIYGVRDPGAICPSLQQAGLARAVSRTGGHIIHGSEGPGLADTILGSLDRQRWTR
jgi:type IV secretory pathway VirJ component